MPEVLAACAAQPSGRSLAELSTELDLPKTSVHRLLRTLEHGGYLLRDGAAYRLGPESFKLADLMHQAQPTIQFPAFARPVLEWLARETNESVVLGTLAKDHTVMVVVDSMDSTEPLRYTLPVGERRELYRGASGRVVLAFLGENERGRYIDSLDVPPAIRDRLPEILENARQSGVVFDVNGNVEGASAISAPIFDRQGRVFSAVSIAGPTDRMIAHHERFEGVVRTAGERISRLAGLKGDYPPRERYMAPAHPGACR